MTCAETPIPAKLCNQMCRAASSDPATSWAAPLQWSVRRSISLGGRLPALHLLPCMHEPRSIGLAFIILEPNSAASSLFGSRFREPIADGCTPSHPCAWSPRYVLVNDWSTRDIQRWEYVPLGPFTSKNFVSCA